jgi:hypothetical protein
MASIFGERIILIVLLDMVRIYKRHYLNEEITSLEQSLFLADEVIIKLYCLLHCISKLTRTLLRQVEMQRSVMP